MLFSFKTKIHLQKRGLNFTIFYKTSSMVMTKMLTKNHNSLQCNMGRLFQSDKRIFRSWEILVYFLFCDCKPSFFLNVIQVTSPSPSPSHNKSPTQAPNVHIPVLYTALRIPLIPKCICKTLWRSECY